MTAARAILTMPLALLLAACGSPARPAGAPVTPAASVSAAATAAPAAAPVVATPAPTAVPAPPPLIVLAEAAGQQTRVTLVDVSGHPVATAIAPVSQAWLVEAGPGGAYWVAGGRLHRLGAGGGVADLGAVPPNDGGGFSVSPSGDAIVFHTSAPVGTGQTLDNRLYVAQGGTARLLASRIADGTRPALPDALQLWQYRTLSWTDQGVLIAREPQGGCGCGPFGMESVDWHTALVDPATGSTTPVNDSETCPLSGTGPGGLAACFHTVQHGESMTADQLRILHSGAVTARFDLSGANVGGAAVFSPDGSRIAYATVPQGADCASWQGQTTMRVLDIAGGAARALPTAGLQPLAWLRDGRIVAVQSAGRAGTTRVVLVDPGSGAVTPIHSSTAQPVVRMAAAA
jgi:hypothetical protein